MRRQEELDVQLGCQDEKEKKMGSNLKFRLKKRGKRYADK